MTRFQKIMASAYVVLYAFGILVVYMDVFEWRGEERKLSGAELQASEQAKAYAKGGRP
jgi:hypothetical protein